MNKTFWNSAFHAVLQGIVWLGPVLIANLGTYGNLTVSAILSAGVFYLHNKYLVG